ncbi:MAG TPA: response regulator [Verrucomicrobiae bacterium]|nr:response regulator [Verrucomicrobiae bacterium]
MHASPDETEIRILFADDDSAFRESYAELLRRHGYHCRCTADSAAALEVLRNEPVDLLLADIHMPGNADLALVREAAVVCEGVPTILMTGRPSVESAALSVRLPVIGYLVKPPDLRELLSLIAEAVPRYRRLRSMAAARDHLGKWTEDLAALEARLRRSDSATEQVTHDYFRVTLGNLMLQLADLTRLLEICRTREAVTPAFQELDFANAVRHTIDVLERTRRQFRSKELGDLRRRLESLVPSRQVPQDATPEESPSVFPKAP